VNSGGQEGSSGSDKRESSRMQQTVQKFLGSDAGTGRTFSATLLYTKAEAWGVEPWSWVAGASTTVQWRLMASVQGGGSEEAWYSPCKLQGS
jgi:hypothetical protein